MRHKPVILCVAIVLTACVGGCAGYKTVEYFSPLPSADTKVLRTFRSLDEVASISLGGDANLRAIVFDEPRSPRLRLIIELPEGETLQFADVNIVAAPLTKGAPVTAKISTIQANVITGGVGRFVYFTGKDRLVGSTYRYKKMFGDEAIVHRYFEIDANFESPLPDQFQIRLPDMRMTRGLVVPTLITFRRMIGEAYQGSSP